MSIAIDIPMTMKGDTMKIFEDKTWKENRSPDFTLPKRIFKERKK